VVRAIQQVAERLGNTPSVCRKCYVHPQVIAAYLDGTLAAALDVRGHVPGDARTTVAGAERHLRAEELAVLALLERRLADEKKGSGLGKQLRRSLRAAIARGRSVHTAPSRTTVAPFM
jgi:DNA topoisomerase I